MRNGSSGSTGGFVLFVFLWVVTHICAANFSETRPIRTAETHGFTDSVIVSDTIWFVAFKSCGLSDKVWYMEGERNGVEVSFLVCGGIFKTNYVVVR